MKKNILHHLGLIIDGNRRWARKRCLPTMVGHEAGYRKLKKVGDWCLARGINILTVYTFSCENWQRSKKEVNYLMKLILRALIDEVDHFHKRGIQLKIIGQKKGLPEEIVLAINKAEKKTANNKKGILNLAINYTGRVEILDAVRAIIKKKISADQVNEKVFSENLYTSGMPDPELIVRTSGEQRLSGFLSWQSAYSELCFYKKLWPDFSERDLDKILDEYVKRHRRFGR